MLLVQLTRFQRSLLPWSWYCKAGTGVAWTGKEKEARPGRCSDKVITHGKQKLEDRPARGEPYAFTVSKRAVAMLRHPNGVIINEGASANVCTALHLQKILEGILYQAHSAK